MSKRHHRGRCQAVEAYHRDRTAAEIVGRVASTVAHDLNNLFATVSGSCHLLRPSLEGEQDALEDLAAIERAAEDAAALVSQWLLIRREQLADPTEFDLNALITGMERMLRRLMPEGVSLRCLLGSNPALVRADHRAVEQALAVLVMHAAGTASVGRRLTIQTSSIKRLHGAPRSSYNLLTISTSPGLGSVPRTEGGEFIPVGKRTDDATGVRAIDTVIAKSGGLGYLDVQPNGAVTFSLYLPSAKRRSANIPSGSQWNGPCDPA